VLATELGLALSVETVTLAEQIRAHAPVEAHATHAALPPVLTRFFGRQQESARLVDLLSRRTVRLVTLAGPGGVGKTRLAIEVARRLADAFAHDICLVELAGVIDEKSVDDAVAAALRLPTSGRSSTDAIVAYLRDKAMLLVLDNCEHLVKACARLVQTLCREAAGLTVLATSRIPLRLAEEHVVRLEPFATPVIGVAEPPTVAESLSFDAVQLFANRAAHALLQFTLTDANVLAVARICQQLDGIPLAIEIAAAQARALPVEAIADRLHQRFAWQKRRAVETLPRQRTLHTLIDWSYSLLSAPERAMLRQLAVFAGGWSLEAAEAVSAPGEPCAEALAELVDHSLVTFGADGDRRRYSMHETIRQFAQKQLRGSEQEADALERHACYYARLVANAAENRAGQTLPERLRTLQDDHDNVRQAFEWLLAHDREQALGLVARLGTLNFWELGGFFQEGRRWLQRALEDTQALVSAQRGHALLAAADLSSAITDFAYGLQCARQAQDLFQQLGDRRGEIDARLVYCDLARYAGELANLRELVEEALQMAKQMSYTAGMAKGKLLVGITITYTTGDFEEAIQYVLPSVALWRELKSPFELATALNQLGADLLDIHQYGAARQALEECRDIYQSLGYRRGVALAMHNLGCAAHKMGEYVSARELLCESLRIRHHLSLRRGYAYSFEQLAQVNEREERYEQAVQLWAAAEILRVRIGAPLEQVEQQDALAALPRLRTQLGDVAFELAWSKGATMTTEQVIALALS
jgi:predicted ATPase